MPHPGVSLSISPGNQTESPGSTFDIKVVINTDGVTSRGAQCSLTFDPSLLQCDSVDEGDFFKTWAQSHSCSTLVFPAPEINNNVGQVSDIGVAIMGQTAGGPSGSGTFCTYHMAAKVGARGQSSITLTDAQVADQTGAILHGITVNNGQVTVGNMTSPLTPTSTPISTPTPTPTATAVPYAGASLSISPADQTESPGSTFDIRVMINTGNVTSRGAQCSLTFDPSLLQCNSVDEGDFLKTWAQSHSCSTLVFPAPEINNNVGQVSDIGVAIVGQTVGGPSGGGTFCTYHMTAKAGARGQASVALTDAQIADQTGTILQGITVNNGQVTVANATPTSINEGAATPTPAPMPSVTPPPASSAPGLNWSLIGGIIGAVIVIGAVIYFLFARRRNTSAS